jgi:cytoskeletal protein CcmA (bactofilin family)
MAIFNSSDKEANGTTQTTIIAEGTQIKGEIDIETPLNIFGKFIGNIQSKSIVTIGSKGFSTGNISAVKLIINGAFDGEAICQTIEILENGVANGTIKTNRLIIEDGGFFEGESRKMDTNNLKSNTVKESKKDEQSKDIKESKDIKGKSKIQTK